MERIKIDLTPSCVKPILRASQYDNGREWPCEVLKDGTPYKFVEGDVCEIHVRKGDGCGVTASVPVTVGQSFITITSTEQMCAVYGDNIGELVVTNGTKKIGSCNLILSVEADPMNGSKSSNSEIHDLQNQVNECVDEALSHKGASDIAFDNTDTGLEATNVQSAIEEVNTKTDEKANADDVYTKTETDTKLGEKANVSDVYDKTETNALLNAKADASDVSASLALKADQTTVNEISTKSKNLNDKSIGRYRVTNGVINNVPTSTTIVGMSDKVPCKANTTYTSSMYNLTGASTLYFAWYDNNGDWISTESKSSTTTITKTSPANAAYVYTCAYRSAGLPDISTVKIQIEEGDVPTSYVSPLTALDSTARESIATLQDKTVDISEEIVQVLFNAYYKNKYVYHAKTTYNNWIVIPSQSLFDVEYAKQLGFKAIELNVQKTSDNHFICYHGVDGTWGDAVYAEDLSDISNVKIDTMTLAQIQANVRYKSVYDKFKVAPATLEETLYVCKNNGIIPCIQNTSGVIEIADSICGKGNYILQVYQSDRATEMPPVICSWLTITDKDELVNKCKASGGSYVALLNASNVAYSGFDVDDWKELAETVHLNGYKIGAAYVSNPNLLNTLNNAGFDYIYSSYQVNEFDNGNICNLEDNVSFGGFSTNGLVQNESIVLNTGESVTPNIDLPICLFGGGYLRVKFEGSLVVKMGRYLTDVPAYVVTSAEPKEFEFSTIFENELPTFTILAKDTTTIYELSYKASKVDAIPLEGTYTKSEVDAIVANAIDSVLPTDSVSGAVANFKTSLAKPLVSIDVDNSATKIYQRGENLWSEEWELGSISNTTGEDAPTTTQYRTKGFIAIPKGENLYLFNGNSDTLGFRFYDSNKSFIGARAIVTDKSMIYGTNDLPTGTAFVRFINTSTNEYANNISINYPNTDTEYHAYNANCADYDVADIGNINTFAGVNNIFTDNGDIDVSFKCSVEDYVNAHSGGGLRSLGGSNENLSKGGDDTEDEPKEDEKEPIEPITRQER